MNYSNAQNLVNELEVELSNLTDVEADDYLKNLLTESFKEFKIFFDLIGSKNVPIEHYLELLKTLAELKVRIANGAV